MIQELIGTAISLEEADMLTIFCGYMVRYCRVFTNIFQLCMKDAKILLIIAKKQGFTGNICDSPL
jgi:hypothetical protein